MSTLRQFFHSRRMAFHDFVGHPFMELFRFFGFLQLAHWAHEATLPATDKTIQESVPDIVVRAQPTWSLGRYLWHNIVGHILLGACLICGLRRLGEWFHTMTMPKEERTLPDEPLWRMGEHFHWPSQRERIHRLPGELVH